ncbi:peptidoglycan editing factor PgeF [Thermomonas sp.]|uniref:peptidoglycan editing factor PgeF n=1 Tax=Thermomonas sp. TaxID=1971895 RepID=UPI002488E348|nr:peptidoglycan editing factor PgeF [Thermomonas sp.]MDI1254318.1 peptidoglycan editing factor PgeF [Thermomonas sp.]
MTRAASTAWLDADWPAPPGVRALTTLRHGLGGSQAPFDALNLGLRCGDEPATVIENRQQLEAALALPSAPRWLHQVHGIEVAIEPGVDEPEADASVTSTPGTVLAILTADCLPAIFAAQDGSEIAAAHAGWRGLADGMLEAAVAAMHTPADDIVAWLGPCAGSQVYEIGQEVFDAFVLRDARAASAFVATRPGHWRVDLHALARQRLANTGIAPNNIYGGGLCTISDPLRFFSHRRDQRSGRMATLVWREGS